MFKDIEAMHRKYELHPPTVPQLLSDSEFKFRLKFLLEELDEFATAHSDMDIVKAADALVDLAVVTLGTAHLMGLPWDSLWSAVHAANMRKRRALHPSESKRGSTRDIIKPEGWVGPESEIRKALQLKGADL